MITMTDRSEQTDQSSGTEMWMTMSKAARETGSSLSTVRYGVDRGFIPAQTVLTDGYPMRVVRLADVLAYLAQRATETP